MPASNVAAEKRSQPQILVETAGLSEEEWLAYRRKGIGGSDVAALLGISPWRTARDLYFDKLNIVAVEDNEDNWVALEMGHLLEPLVAKIFQHRTGYKVYQIKKMFQHPQYSWMLADVDYFVELPDGSTAILEIKTTNYNARDNWWLNGEETVPVYYETQGRHYMAVMNVDRCFFCCLYGNNEEETIIREIRRDESYEEEMIFLEQYFWENHVLMRIKGALFWALEDSKGKNGHLFLTSEALQKEALQLLNAKIPIPSLRLHAQEVSDVLEDMILHGEVVSVKGDIYLPRVFAQEDETARRIAMRVVEPPAPEKIEQILEQVKREIGLALSSKQEAAVYATYRHNLSIITGSPGTGKTTVLKTILEVYRRLHPQGEIALMAPTGRASRRMAESTGVDKAKTLHSILGLASEEDEIKRNNTQEPLSADLIIVDEFSMVDMWLANKFFSRIKGGARVILVGDPDQLPSVGAGNVFRELIDCGLITVTVLDQIFRQSKDSLIAYNAKFINEGNTKLYYGQDFVFMASNNQAEAAERIVARYCREIEESGIDRVQILSPFRSDGAASAEQLNEAIREVVNPFRSAEEEIKIGVKVFRVNDRIMQTKNTAKVSNGDLGFIRYIKNDEDGTRVGLDFGVGRELEYGIEDMVNLDLAYRHQR